MRIQHAGPSAVDFCESVLKEVGLPLQPVAALVEQLEPTGRGVSATLSGGARMVARRAIVASNGAGPHWPVWARRARSEALPERICLPRNSALTCHPRQVAASWWSAARSTAAVVERLRSSGALRLCQAGVERAEWRSGARQVRTWEGPTIECDWIWLATGWTPSLADHTLLDRLQRARPAPIARRRALAGG